MLAHKNLSILFEKKIKKLWQFSFIAKFQVEVSHFLGMKKAPLRGILVVHHKHKETQKDARLLYIKRQTIDNP